MGKLLKIGEAAMYLNVSQDTLRKWDKADKLKSLETAGGHRRYDTDTLDEFLGKKKKELEETPIVCATYARVSSNEQKQKGDLDRQSQRLSEYCAKKGLLVTHIIKDVGSGLNDNRSGFNRLTELVIQKKVNKLVIEHKDRLTRFQFNFIKKMFESYGCEVIVINGVDVSSEEEVLKEEKRRKMKAKLDRQIKKKFKEDVFTNLIKEDIKVHGKPRHSINGAYIGIEWALKQNEEIKKLIEDNDYDNGYQDAIEKAKQIIISFMPLPSSQNHNINSNLNLLKEREKYAKQVAMKFEEMMLSNERGNV